MYVFRRTSGVKGLNRITYIRFLGDGRGGQRPALFKGVKIFLRVKCEWVCSCARKTSCRHMGWSKHYKLDDASHLSSNTTGE